MRELSDFAQLFFIADDTKIKGNKAYDQGNYYKALEVYEQVLSCYVWLEFINADFKDKIFSSLDSEGIKDDDIDMKERMIIREADRDIETDTSKSF